MNSSSQHWAHSLSLQLIQSNRMQLVNQMGICRNRVGTSNSFMDGICIHIRNNKFILLMCPTVARKIVFFGCYAADSIVARIIEINEKVVDNAIIWIPNLTELIDMRLLRICSEECDTYQIHQC